MTDKTVDVPGGDGQYYFGTTFKNRTFTVNYVFDDLTTSEFYRLKRVFNGTTVADLIFDEAPEEIWSAKVTGTASVKYLCFEENGDDVYKGEGSITFTCYSPYARLSSTTPSATSVNIGSTPAKFIVSFIKTPRTEATSSLNAIVYKDGNTERKIEFTAVNFKIGSKITWDSEHGLLKFQKEKDGEWTTLTYTGEIDFAVPVDGLIGYNAFGIHNSGATASINAGTLTGGDEWASFALQCNTNTSSTAYDWAVELTYTLTA